MPRISAAEFGAVPLRAQTLLAGIPLHDAWAVNLPRTREPVTLADFDRRRRRDRSLERLSAPARALFGFRFFLGRLFGLEAEPGDSGTSSFALRLTPEDAARSSVPAGTREGLFRVVYRFEDETCVEVQNRTVHAAAVTALTQTAQGYRYYFAVYVAKTSWITPLYMALIDPFRRWIIYPGLLKSVRATWLELVE